MVKVQIGLWRHNKYLSLSGIQMWGSSKIVERGEILQATTLNFKTFQSMIVGIVSFQENFRTFLYLITYLLVEFQARVCRASCNVDAISGNNSCNGVIYFSSLSFVYYSL